jgi:hypothetical protein
MKELRTIGLVCLVLFSIYSIFFIDRHFDWFVVTCWVVVFYYWWLEDRDLRKAIEEERRQKLASRTIDVEGQDQGACCPH